MSVKAVQSIQPIQPISSQVVFLRPQAVLGTSSGIRDRTEPSPLDTQMPEDSDYEEDESATYKDLDTEEDPLSRPASSWWLPGYRSLIA